jgi:hypothetical protein
VKTRKRESSEGSGEESCLEWQLRPLDEANPQKKRVFVAAELLSLLSLDAKVSLPSSRFPVFAFSGSALRIAFGDTSRVPYFDFLGCNAIS